MIRCDRKDQHTCLLGHHLATAMPAGAIQPGDKYRAELVGGPRDGWRYDLPASHPLPAKEPTPYLAIGVDDADGMYHLDGPTRDGQACRYVWRSGHAV